MNKNKVKFGLKNAHYAKLTINEDGSYSFAEPVSIPGSVSLSMEAQGEIGHFYADDIDYYTTSANNGYEGDLEIALVPENFRIDILGEGLDSNNVLVERSDAELSAFALLFEFTGDKNAIRHVLYNCTATRPSVESKTKEESVEVATETLTLSASPLPSGLIKVKTGDNTSEEIYNDWYKSVYQPYVGD